MRASFGKKTTTSKPSATDGTMQNRCRPPSGIGIRTYRYLQPKRDPPAPPFTSDTTHPPEAIRTGGFLFSGAAAAIPPQNLHDNRTNVNRTNNETFIDTTHLCRPHAPWRMQQRRRHHRTARARHHARLSRRYLYRQGRARGNHHPCRRERRGCRVRVEHRRRRCRHRPHIYLHLGEGGNILRAAERHQPDGQRPRRDAYRGAGAAAARHIVPRSRGWSHHRRRGHRAHHNPIGSQRRAGTIRVAP